MEKDVPYRFKNIVTDICNAEAHFGRKIAGDITSHFNDGMEEICVFLLFLKNLNLPTTKLLDKSLSESFYVGPFSESTRGSDMRALTLEIAQDHF